MPDTRTHFKDIAVYNKNWDDLRFPVQGINPPGAASDPSRDNLTGTLLFSPSAENIIGGIAQMPHCWVQGSDVVPHVHWCKTSGVTGGVVWELAYSWKNLSGVLDFAPTNWIQASSVIGTSDTSELNNLYTFGKVSGSGMKASSMIYWKIRRNVGDDSDNYDAPARFLEFDIHYQTDTLGSDTEYVKTDVRER